MTQRRVPASLVAALLVCSLLLGYSLVRSAPAEAGEPPGGWTKAVKVRSADDDKGHDAVVVDDRMHAVFAGHRGEDPNAVTLWYGTNDTSGATWTFEVVKELVSLTDPRPAIAVDPQGVVHLAYHYRTPEAADVVEVASSSGDGWTFEMLAGPEGADIGEAGFPDIALQADGSPAVVFTGLQQSPCTGHDDLYLSELSGGGWTPPLNVSLNDDNCRQHTFPALAGGSGGLHLVYRAVDGVSGETGIHYRSGTLTNATDETVDEVAGGAVLGVDVIADGAGTPHAVYLTDTDSDEPGDAAMYARRDAGTWTSEVVIGSEGGVNVFGDPSIAISSNGPAVAFTEGVEAEGPDALLAEDTAEGWNVKNLNSESQDNRDPVLASTPGQRLHALLLREASSDVLLYMHEAPRAQTEFAVAGAEFRGGEEVDMSGDIDPATVRERVKIETQKFKDGSWRAYDLKKLRTRTDGSFDYTHEPFPAGKRYRSRLIWGDTIDHLDGRTVWDNFLVERKRAH